MVALEAEVLGYQSVLTMIILLYSIVSNSLLMTTQETVTQVSQKVYHENHVLLFF